MKKTKTKFILFAVVFLMIFSFTSSEKVSAQSAAVGDNGIWADFSTIDDSCSYTYECPTLKRSTTYNNINFPSLTFPERLGRPNKYAEVNFVGSINVPVDGNYEFNIDRNAGIYTYLSVPNYFFSRSRWVGSGPLSCVPPTDPEKLKNFPCVPNHPEYVPLKKGWNRIIFAAQIDRTIVTPKLILSYGLVTPQGTVTFAPIPDENLSWRFDSKEEITIPSSGKAKIDFYTAGVGVNNYLKNNENPKISLKIPDSVLKPGPTNADFTYDAYVFWYDNNTADATPEIKIKNTSIAGSTEKSVEGKRLKTVNGIPLSGVYAEIPSSLNLIRFNEATREMNLVFGGLSSSRNGDGLGVIIPYKNINVGDTRLYLRFPFANTYHGTFSPVTFSIPDDVRVDLKPIFFFPDGNTRADSSEIRPNFISMLTGNNTDGRPGATSLLYKDRKSEMVFPRRDRRLDVNNPDTWYPVFGREGERFDVLSTQGNYLPNREVSYIHSGGDGIIEDEEVNNEDWVSFQWYSSNFSEDEVAGDPESGGISVIGLLGGIKNSKLALCLGDPVSIKKGDTKSFNAWYWDDYRGAGDPPCAGTEFDTALTNSEVVNVTNDPHTTWSSDNSLILNRIGDGSFRGMSAGNTFARASYNHPGRTENVEDSVHVTVTDIIPLCYYNLCDNGSEKCELTRKVCETPSPSQCTSDVECMRDNPWREVAP